MRDAPERHPMDFQAKLGDELVRIARRAYQTAQPGEEIDTGARVFGMEIVLRKPDERKRDA